jgi:hypothetical protein
MLVIAIGVALFLISQALSAAETRRLEREFGAAWHAFNAAAYHPQTFLASDGIHHRTRVADVWQSTGGRKAVVITDHPGTGTVVHEFTAKGVFSSKGPYYLKVSPRVWQPTHRRHLIEAIVHRGTVQTSNPSGGETRESGYRILEFNTTRYPPVTLRAYAAWVRRQHPGG